MATKPGLYANIAAKKKRIKAGSGEKMRKVGTKGAPTAKAFKDSAKTAKKQSSHREGMLNLVVLWLSSQGINELADEKLSPHLQ